MIRVLVVDDHPVVRHGVSAMLRYEPEIQVVGEAADGAEAVRLINEQHPDIVLLDLHLPILSGVEVMQQVRAKDRSVRFLVLTTYDTDEYIAPALAAGAQGYLLKDAPPDELVRAVRTMMSGGSPLQPTVAAKILERMSDDEHEDDELSARELAVLAALAQGSSNKEIALHLSVSENTIKTYLSRIFDKLHVHSRAEAVAVALKRKLIPVTDA